MEYFVFLIPVFVLAISYYYFHHKITIGEFSVQLIVPVLLIFLLKWILSENNVTSTEYWTNPVQKVEYFEDWDEWIDETCECCCDDDGNNCTTYDCSYRRYHEEYWLLTTSTGSYKITQQEFKRISNLFSNIQKVDLNRDYYRKDGDKWLSVWPGTNKTLESVSTAHKYRNKIKASKNVFNFPDIDTSDINRYGLYDYPSIKNLKQRHILGLDDSVNERKMEILNSRLGPTKQVKVFILFFTDKDKMAGQMQEWYWKGGNKNEFIICIGLDKSGKVKWNYIFSWTEKAINKIEIRNYIDDQIDKKIKLSEIIDYTYTILNNNFVRKQFKDFEYLKIDMTGKQLLLLYSIILIFSISLAVFIVKNDIN